LIRFLNKKILKKKPEIMSIDELINEDGRF